MATAEDYAATRAYQDAKDSNEFAKGAAQAAMVINGGAGTAVLAFLSKGGVAGIAKFAAIALGVYAIGVVAGAATFLTLIYCVEEYSNYWETIADGDEKRQHSKRADYWAAWSTRLCLCALGCFVVASLVLAWAFYNYLA
jgi:hypothetical protein